MVSNVPSAAAVRSVSRLLSPATRDPKRVLRSGLLIAFTSVALLAVAQAVDFGAFNLDISWLDADHRLSVFAIASLLAQAATAAASIGRGYVAAQRRTAWFALGALVGALVVIRGLTMFNASVLAVPLLCVFVLLSLLTWSNKTSRTTVWAALLLLAVSLLLHKVGLDADSSPASDYTWAYQLVGIVKHGTELAGWTLTATGIAAGTAASGPPRQMAASPQPGSAVGISPSSD